MLQKFAGPLVGAPVRLNMPNMPKSASELVHLIEKFSLID